MTGELVISAPCAVCGYRCRGLAIAVIRPAMRSLRAEILLGLRPWRCDECGRRHDADQWGYALTVETMAQVDAWRDRQRVLRRERKAS